jgi:hypothetical protein
MPEKRMKPAKQEPKIRKPRPKRHTYDIESISEDDDDQESVEPNQPKAMGSDEEGRPRGRWHSSQPSNAERQAGKKKGKAAKQEREEGDDEDDDDEAAHAKLSNDEAEDEQVGNPKGGKRQSDKHTDSAASRPSDASTVIPQAAKKRGRKTKNAAAEETQDTSDVQAPITPPPHTPMSDIGVSPGRHRRSMNSSSEPLLQGLPNSGRRRSAAHQSDVADTSPTGGEESSAAEPIITASIEPERVQESKVEPVPQQEVKVKKGRWVNHQPKAKIKPPATSGWLYWFIVFLLISVRGGRTVPAAPAWQRPCSSIGR